MMHWLSLKWYIIHLEGTKFLWSAARHSEEKLDSMLKLKDNFATHMRQQIKEKKYL